jgi:serine/threonine protein kinase
VPPRAAHVLHPRPQAPELFLGDRYGPAVDVYSFGIVAWELAARETPWDELGAKDYLDEFNMLDMALRTGRRPTVPARVEAAQPTFVAMMRRCWATRPDDRPSFSEVVLQLEAAAAADGEAAATADISIQQGDAPAWRSFKGEFVNPAFITPDGHYEDLGDSLDDFALL